MYRIGKEEIDAVARVIRSGNLFKINDAARKANSVKPKCATTSAAKKFLS